MKSNPLAGALFALLILAGCAATIEPVTPAMVNAYLAADTELWIKDYEARGYKVARTPRFVQNVKMRVMVGATATEAAMVGKAVAILNALLPEGRRVPFNVDDRTRETDELEPGGVYVFFAHYAEWPEAVKIANSSHRTLAAAWPFVRDKDAGHRIVGGAVFVNSERVKTHSGKDLVEVILHEFLHVAGRSHPDSRRFPQTIMNYAAPSQPPGLPVPPGYRRISGDLWY